MKKSIKILGMLLAVAALPLMYSCEDEIEYKAAEPVSGPQVFFSADTELDVNVMDDEPWFEVVLYRGDTEGSVSFSFDKSGDADKFDIPDAVSFANGEEETSITIGYDPEDFPEFGDFYEFTIAIPDGYNTPYGLSSATFTVTKEEPWISLGYAEFCDWFFFYNENEDTSIGGYLVEIQQNELSPNKFRLVHPYDEGLVAEGYGDPTPEDDNTYMTFQILEPGKTIAEQTSYTRYTEMVTMDDLIFFEDYDTGYFYDYYSDQMYILHPCRFDSTGTEEYWTHNCVLEYQANGLPAVVQLAPYYYMFNNGGWNYSQYDEVIWIIFPGAEVEEPADYSVEVEYTGKYTDADDAEYIVAEVTMGPDVEYTAVVLTEGSDPTSALYGILLDTIEYQKVTENGTVVFDAPTETGYYTVLAVSYGDEDYQYYDWDTFFYSVGGGDVDPWVVETTGDYAFSGFYYEGTDTGLILYSNSYDDTLYRIADWGAGVDFTFNWDKETNELYVQEQQTGEAYGSYGDVYVCDLSDYYATATYYGTPGYYEDGTFYFGIAYYCSGGGFGYGYESFKTKGGTLGVPLADVAGTYDVFEIDGYSGYAWYGEYVIEESDDPSKGNIMFTLFDDFDCDIANVYGTYDETTGTAEFECDQMFAYDDGYYLAASLYSYYDEYPIKFMFFNDGAFWGPFYGDYMTLDAYMSLFGNYMYVGFYYAYEYLYGVKDEAEPDSIKPASAGISERVKVTEPVKKEDFSKKTISYSKKPVKNSAVKPASVAPVEHQKTGCQPVKKATKKVVPPTPGTPTPVTK